MKKSRLLALLFALAAFVSAHAAEPTRFVRLVPGDTIVAGARYVLLSSLQGERVALTGVATGTKLRGLSVRQEGDTILVDDAAAVWVPKVVSGGMTWQTTTGYLAAVAEKADLRVGTSPYVWQVELRADTLLLIHADESRMRMVGFDTFKRYFGCYAESGYADYGGLLLFRAVSDGEADTTTTGGDVALDTALTYALVARHGEDFFAASARMTTDFRLRSSHFSGNLAADSLWVTGDDDLGWRLALRPDGGYDLVNHEGNCLIPYTYQMGELGFELRSNSPADEYWVLRDGRLVAVDADHRLWHLVYNPTGEGRFATVSLVTSGFEPVSPVALTAEGTVHTQGKGALSLDGHFSAARLQSLMVDTVLSLDMTHAVLPLRAQPFDDIKQGNALIYVSARMASFVPAEWRNVIVCDSDPVGRVLRPVRLIDGRPFAVNRPFAVGPDSLSYSRPVPADGNWSTLYLPFRVSAFPANVQPYRYTGIENDQLNIEPVGTCGAYSPVLLKRDADVASPDTVCFVADAQIIEAQTETQGEFCGTLVRLDISADNVCYLLADDGQRFVRASVGSYVSPFRCYLTTDKAARAMLIDINQTDIHSVRSKKEQRAIYSLEGMKLPVKPRRGFYIENRAIHRAK